MNRLRKTTTTTLLIAIFLISAFAIATVSAQENWGKPEVMVSAMGHFTANFDMGSEPTVGHRCFINLHAKKVADEWTGQGVFRDEDYSAGKLVATFTVKRSTSEDLPHQVNYAITADVSIDDEYVGTFGGFATLFMGELFEAFSFQIPWLLPEGYYAFDTGYDPEGEFTDISVKLKLRELE